MTVGTYSFSLVIAQTQKDGQSGLLYINREEVLDIQEIRRTLGIAISQGMKLAIFNSCDGLGLAQQLTDLNIPHIIVWREPVPDKVAQQFLKYFIHSFSTGKTLHRSLLEARLQIKELTPMEQQLPGVTNLPVIVGSTEEPITWKRLRTGGRLSGECWDNAIMPPEDRKALLDRVKNYWVKGPLNLSLHNQVMVELGLDERFDNHLVFESPEHRKMSLPPGTRVIDKFDDLGVSEGKTLLLLGKAGSGKTTALLEMASDLLADADEDITIPVPVVLLLPSWGADKQFTNFTDWLVDELDKKYLVAKAQARRWIQKQKLLLLLDGLDEVKVEHCESCIREINQFIREHKQTSIVICSRVQEYDSFTEKLKFQGIVELQPLNQEKISRYFDDSGKELAALKQMWLEDKSLKELAETPLMLNVMTIAYQGLAKQDIPRMGSAEEYRCHLFDAYIERMFERGRANQKFFNQKYPKNRAIPWLTWLAKKMISKSQQEFMIQQIQPDINWLPIGTDRKLYRICIRLITGLLGGIATVLHAGTQATDELTDLINLAIPGIIAGLVAGLLSTMIDEKIDRDIPKLIAGLFSGLIFVLIFAQTSTQIVIGSGHDVIKDLLFPLLIDGFVIGILWGLMRPKIQEVDTIKWTWHRFIEFSQVGFFCGLIYVLLHIFFVRDFYSKKILSNVLTELIIFTLLSGIVGGMDKRSNIDKNEILIPNQDIWRALSNIKIYFTILVPVGMCCSFPYSKGGLHEVISIGLAVGILAAVAAGQRSGLVLIQHLTLRVILWARGYIPWNYALFLNYATELIFLKRSGGIYMFYHRTLMEHYAQMNSRI